RHSPEGDLDDVITAVTLGVGGETVKPAIFLFRKRRVAAHMRSRKLYFTGDEHCREVLFQLWHSAASPETPKAGASLCGPIVFLVSAVARLGRISIGAPGMLPKS